MGKISDTGIKHKVVLKVLDFLNNATSAKDIVSLKRATDNLALGNEDKTKDYDIGEVVAQRIIDKRDSLKGFSKLSELSDIKGFGTDKFNDLVDLFKELSTLEARTNLPEPLFRFASVRYLDTKPQTVATKNKEIVDKGSKEETNAPKVSKVRKLSDQEIKDLEKAHVAALARYDIKFIKQLVNKLTDLNKEYYSLKNKALANASANHNKLVEQKIKAYETNLSEEEKIVLETKKNILLEASTTDEKNEKLRVSPIYPPSLVSSFEFNYEAFSSLTYLKDRLEENELSYLKKNNLLELDFQILQSKLNENIKEKQFIAAHPELKWEKKTAIKGAIFSRKNRYKNGYAVSFKKEDKTFFLSLIIPNKKSFITSADLLVSINGKEYKTKIMRTIENTTRQLFLEGVVNDMPDLKPNTSFSYKYNIELNSGEKISLNETVSTQNQMWIGQYIQQKTDSNKVEKSFYNNNTINDLQGIMKVGFVDLMIVEQELCCYVPGDVAHIENIMAREYKEKSTEYLERSESTYTQEIETETIEKNDTTSVEKHDWNKEIQRTIENSTDFNLSGTVSYGSKQGPWYASINSDLGIAHSKTQSNTNAQSYSKEITQNALESIRNRSFEKRSTTLIKQFKEENKHGFDNRAGDQHVSGVFRWIDKIYKNRIIHYGTHTLLEFMVPKPSELYIETLTDDDKVELPEPPKKPNLNSWQDITRDNYMTYINEYGVSDYNQPKDDTKYDRMEIGFINSEFDWANENKNTVTKSYQFNSVLVNDYYLEAVFPNTQANTTDWKIRVHNPFWKHFAKFQVFLKNSTNQVKIVDDTSFSSKIVHEKDVAGNVINRQGLNFENSVDVFIDGSHVRWLNYLNLNFRFKLKLDAFVKWQKETYQSIMDAYQAQVDKYNSDLAAVNQANPSNNNTNASLYNADQYKNPGFYKEIIHTELKRLCIELLFTQSNTSIDRCEDYYDIDDSCICEDGEKGVPVISKDKLSKLDHYASVVKLFEQSLLWSVMSFNLYDYHWAEKCDWADMLHNNDKPDNYFQKFLKSGMARVLVPIREGFEEPLINFITTGNVSLDPNNPNDLPYFLSIMEELKKPVGDQVGEPWKTTVPSTLTLIQGDTVFLKNQGLPCCGDVAGSNGITPSQAKLEGKDDNSTAIDGEE